MLRPHLLRKLKLRASHVLDLFALKWQVFLTSASVSQAQKNLVDVTGIEPVTPCLQTGGKGRQEKSKSLFGLRLAHDTTRTVPLNCFKLAPKNPIIEIVALNREHRNRPHPVLGVLR
jgi:hypothetical protein